VPKPSAAASGPERFPIASCRERWLEFLALEHETLPPVADFAWSEGELLVRREPVTGRPLSGGRVPRPARAALLLQAAAAAAFFASRGFPLAADDFECAVWDVAGGAARLWLTRTPSAVRAVADTPTAEAIAAALIRLFSREGGRVSPAAARVTARIATY